MKRYIEEAKPPKVDGRIVATIAPHAGYRFSGPVAGYTFRALADQAAAGNKPDVVVILGFSHSIAFPGVSLMEGDGIETPLGVAALDSETGRKLTNLSSRLFFKYALHRDEHSAENEIPFVQAALPGVKIVVGVFGEHDPRNLETVTELAKALNELAKTRNVLVVASTDMRHNADYDLVAKTDAVTLKAIEAMDEQAMVKQGVEADGVCGIMPVLTVMRFAALQGCKKAVTLRYRNSGDDYPESRGNWVVGYGAVAFAVEKQAWR
ncbi:MAG: AmmeMemoRadiSam system protein B [Verrucomicrobiota bacterium]|nr:AmmeMemoRadiSam system protein B [Verrucomicrobiota bacterium]